MSNLVPGTVATPALRQDNLHEVVRLLKLNVDSLIGQADPKNRAVTAATASGVGGQTIVYSGGGSGSGSSYDPYTDNSTPPAPTGLQVFGSYETFIVRWDVPPSSTYKNHDHTEVWASSTDSRGSATLRGRSTTNFFTLDVGNSETLYFWIRFVSMANVTGPDNATPGTPGTTSFNIPQALAALASQIGASHLDATLTSRINLIDGPDTLSGSVAARVAAEAAARLAADGVASGRIDNLEASVDTPSTGLLARATVLETRTTSVTIGNQALANRAEVLESAVTAPGTGLLSRATILEDRTTSATVGNEALATKVTSLESAVLTPSTGLLSRASVLENTTTNATSGNLALSNRTLTLEAKISTPSATPGDPAYNPTYAGLQVEASARATLDGNVRSLYTVRTEVSSGGRTMVGGFGLAGTAGGAEGPRIDFGVRADRFYVAAPSGDGAPDTYPFVVQSTPWSENGFSRPAGVYMDAVWIKNLTAVYGTFQSLVATDIAAAEINVAKLTGGVLQVSGYIQSADYTAGPGGTGYRLDRNGIVLPSTSIRGQLSALQIDGTGLVIREAGTGRVLLGSGSGLPIDYIPPGAINANQQWSEVNGRPKSFRVAARGLGCSAGYPIEAGLYNGETNAALWGAVRSWMVVAIDRATGVIAFADHFDIFGGSFYGAYSGLRIDAALDSFGSNRIVVVWTYDEPRANRTDAGFAAAMYKHGASKAVFGSSKFGHRSAYVLIAIGKCGEGNGHESYQGDPVYDPEVGGSGDPNAWVDVTFQITANGGLLVTGTGATPKTLVDYGYVGDMAATKNVVSYQATDPGGANGDVWVDTSTSPAVTKVRVGGSWQLGATVGAKAGANLLDSSGAVLGDGQVKNSAVAAGGNMLRNPDFRHGRDGWAYAESYGIGQAENGVNLDSNWQLAGGNTLYARQVGTANNQNYYFGYFSEVVSVEPGKHYCASAYTGAHRCTVSVFIHWYNSAGTIIGRSQPGTSYNYAEAAGGNSLAGYKRCFSIGQAPPGAVMACIVLRKYDTYAGQGDSWLFVTRTQFEQVGPDATEPGPWTPTGLVGKITPANVSTYIDNVAINLAQINTASIGSLSALTATVGLLRSRDYGSRVEIENDQIRIYDSGALRVKLGDLS